MRFARSSARRHVLTCYVRRAHVLTCYVRRAYVLAVVTLLLASVSPLADRLSPISQQRYAMGTMFDIVVYHPSSSDAQRAIEKAMAEIIRLDQVMSHFKADSDLSKLIRSGRAGFVSVDPSLYEVIHESVGFSRRSGGKFDVTIGPLLKTWKAAHAHGRRPSAVEIAAAKRCVGFDKIELQPPDRIRLNSDCVDIDLGGIGKGYAVDRALAVLGGAGIRHAVVNAGGSSIGAIGHPPDQKGWPVGLGAGVSGRRTLLLRDGSLSTSRQHLVPFALEPGPFGEILDPLTGAPADTAMTVTVVSKSATAADALSTTLLLLSIDEGRKVLADFADASAMWITAAGELKAGYRESKLQLSE